MTEKSRVWDGILVGDASESPYSASEWAYRENQLHSLSTTVFPNYGVLWGAGGGTYGSLSVEPKSPASANIEVEIGAALVKGYLYETTATVTLTVGANVSGNPRIDTVILRVDFVAQTIRLILKQGTPAGSPTRPTLQQDTTYWEIPLADIAVANGFSVINRTDITDRRRAVYSLSNGWMPYAWPMDYLHNGVYPSDSTGGSQPFSSNAGFAVPFVLPGNLALQSLTFRASALALRTTAITWAIYVQDVNDANAAENTLRRIALVDNGSANISPGNATLTASPAPIILTPGTYWLVMKNTNATAFLIGAIAPTGSSFSVQNTFQTHSNPTLGQTLDFVTGWTKVNGAVGVRLNGRVFGQSTAF